MAHLGFQLATWTAVRSGSSLMVCLLVFVASGSGRADVQHQSLTQQQTIPLVACDDCSAPTVPGVPTNARAIVSVCGVAAVCAHGGDIRITVTYVWPGGDPTGSKDGAQTCIRWFAQPPTLAMTPPGYAFGGDCSTNASGTSAEFLFTTADPLRFCAQVDAFRGSTPIGSSNLACLDLTPP
ncbi:MAG: hypothetical protein KC495_11910 [Dehalococcoidia bacterium]|nr:hypothetical protein [Dehalococcoidia bacterium]MCB9485483.1 hypothetical protein [Thermoflexaceae bacterium]